MGMTNFWSFLEDTNGESNTGSFHVNLKFTLNYLDIFINTRSAYITRKLNIVPISWLETLNFNEES